MLAKHISAANRRGRAGALSRKRGLHHGHGGQAQCKRHANLAANRASADVQEKTPKKHPEIAGRGVEYCWGKSKVHFRHNNNYSSNAANLEERVKESMNTADVLTLGRVRKFQRKANDYKRAYLALSNSPEDATELEHKDTEAMKKKCKTHRCTLDQDYAFIKCA